jgi:ParB-like chromosome segregation protein Spo0J
MQIDEKIKAINEIKIALHNISPFKNEPVDCVLWVRNKSVYANDYNPNAVAPPEMELLRHSIITDGYTQPIVAMLDEIGNHEVIDGFHRNRVGKECKDVVERLNGYLPVVTIRDSQQGRCDRIASTIRHNRARGKHKVDSMSEIVLELKRRNWSDKKIAIELGMDQDEILRLKQIAGLADMFADHEFSEAWEAELLTSEDDNIESID